MGILRGSEEEGRRIRTEDDGWPVSAGTVALAHGFFRYKVCKTGHYNLICFGFPLARITLRISNAFILKV